jgi:ribosomal protein L37AE/L43A
LIGKKFCPKCKSEQVYMEAGGLIGVWKCAMCKFSGSIFPEKEKLMEENNSDTKRN